MSLRIPATGPHTARILIVGEAPGAEEERLGSPFVGKSGQELTRMLSEAGISRAECWVTNCCKYRPPTLYKNGKRVENDIEQWIPHTKKGQAQYTHYVHGCGVHHYVAEGYDELCAEIRAVRPNLIIGLGNTPLWMLAQHRGIKAWRGSLLQVEIPGPSGPQQFKFIPTFHPAAVLREWSDRPFVIFDLKRAKRESGDACYIPPTYNFLVRPTLEEAVTTLARLQDAPELACDIETSKGQISCIGFAHSAEDAICIPLHSEDSRINYWSEAEEQLLTRMIRDVLRSPTTLFFGQNFLYDAQYLAKQWGVVPANVFDTMLAQHTLLPGLPKGLGFISSLHCKNHVYWKEEGKTKEKGWTAEVFWRYNCQDAVRTFEAAHSLRRALAAADLTDVAQFQQDLFHPVLNMMLLGTRIDLERRERLRADLSAAIESREAWLERICGHRLNPKSPKQMMAFFYNDLGLPVLRNRKTGTPSMNAEALERLKVKEPLLTPIINCISELRSLGVFRSTFIEAPLDDDLRMRCSYNIAGTETFRFSSSENAFGSGTNMQNLPKGNTPKIEQSKGTENGGENNRVAECP